MKSDRKLYQPNWYWVQANAADEKLVECRDRLLNTCRDVRNLYEMFSSYIEDRNREAERNPNLYTKQQKINQPEENQHIYESTYYATFTLCHNGQRPHQYREWLAEAYKPIGHYTGVFNVRISILHTWRGGYLWRTISEYLDQKYHNKKMFGFTLDFKVRLKLSYFLI